jgi:hypothetical protein
MVESEPPKASILLDGKPIGKTTPADLEIPPGQHTIAVRMEGFRTAIASFNVKGGEQLHYSPNLEVMVPNVNIPGLDLSALEHLGDLGPKEAQEQARFWQRYAQQAKSDYPKLLVNSQPRGARIIVDGKDSGQLTPAVIPTTTGKHHVRLELEDYAPYESDVTVAPHKPGAVNATLQQPQ